MYESFYGLKEKPFSMLPDPGFLYLSKKHQMALTLLEYGLLNQAGFCVVSGETGSGKTTLLRKLLENVDDDVTVGMITNTHKGFGELLDWVLSAFNIHEPGLTQVAMHQRVIDFMIEQYAAKKTTLLIVDEAQNMSAEKLEELRMLSNLNSDKDQVLQVILAGQPELKETLKLPELKQFAQRIAVDYHLGSLDEEETYGYIHHRLEVAGANKEIFTEAACDHIHEYSGGIPRLINLLCDTVLVYGFADLQAVIDADLVDEMIQERMKDSIVPLASTLPFDNEKDAKQKQSKQPKANLRHYPVIEDTPIEQPETAKEEIAEEPDNEDVSSEPPDDRRDECEDELESTRQAESESESIEAGMPQAVVERERRSDVRRREPNTIAIVEAEELIKQDNWKWIAIAAVAVAVIVLTLVFGGKVMDTRVTDNTTPGDKAGTAAVGASSEQVVQEIPERVKKQLAEAEKFREELTRRQEEDRARMAALENEAKRLQRERDAAIAKAKAEQEQRAREAVIIEAAAIKEREAKRLAELAKAEALAAAREKAIMLEELRKAEREVHEKALREQQLLKQKAIQEAESEAELKVVEPEPEVRPVVKTRSPQKKQKGTESFSTDPCSSSTARFLSTCR